MAEETACCLVQHHKHGYNDSAHQYLFSTNGVMQAPHEYALMNIHETATRYHCVGDEKIVILCRTEIRAINVGYAARPQRGTAAGSRQSPTNPALIISMHSCQCRRPHTILFSLGSVLLSAVLRCATVIQRSLQTGSFTLRPV